jgi:hypothetical protein
MVSLNKNWDHFRSYPWLTNLVQGAHTSEKGSVPVLSSQLWDLRRHTDLPVIAPNTWGQLFVH